jgi:diketogulonate reductase-like aldo/keto reductase
MIRQSLLGGLGVMSLPALSAFVNQENMIQRTIPSSGEALPLVGLGTWQTFDVGAAASERSPLVEVLKILMEKGGKVIDSSPMYGKSEAVVGDLTADMGNSSHFFYATKVWTNGKDAGTRQMQASMEKMRRKQMDLMQIHNLVDWKAHVKTLKTWKETGKIRYWGITHYVDSAHEELEAIIRSEQPDFAQFNYSIRSRHAERSLFDSCSKHKTAVIINQPYESGSLFRLVKGKALPSWAAEFDINSWGQYFLKFILSHRAVSCVIPGTSTPEHMLDNAMAGYGRLPDEAGRERMFEYLNTI